MAWGRTSEAWTKQRELLRAAVEGCRMEPGEVIEAPGEETLRVIAERDGVAVEVSTERRREAGSAWWTSLRMRVPGVPVELALRPERFGEGVDKVLGMTVDHEVGDPAFDERFVIEAAPPEVARFLLAAPVRQELLALPPSDVSPMLRLAGGTLVIRWRGAPLALMVEHAASAALHLRAAASELHEGIVFGAESGPFRRGAGALAVVDPAERERARLEIASTRRRTATVLTTAVAVSMGFVVAALLGRLPVFIQ